MPKRDHLVQEARVDKTGKVTKRWVKPSSSTPAKSIPSPLSPNHKAYAEGTSVYAQIAAGMKPRAKREVDLSPEKLDLVDKISGRFLRLGVSKPFQAGYNEQASDERSADLLRSLDNLLSHPDADASLARKLQDRFRQLSSDNLRNWLDVAERYFWELDGWHGDKGSQMFKPTCEIISGYLHMKNEMEFNGQGTPTDQQCRNFLWTQRGAHGSNLDGNRVHEGGGLGVAAYIENEEMKAFILENTDDERLLRVAKALKDTKVSRFTEVLAIADGDTVAPLADGAL